MGGALGVGGLGALLATRLGASVNPDTVGALLDPLQRETALAMPGVIEALGAALDPLFWVTAIAAILAFVTVLAHPRDESTPLCREARIWLVPTRAFLRSAPLKTTACPDVGTEGLLAGHVLRNAK